MSVDYGLPVELLLVFVNRIGRHDKSTIVLLLLFHISSFNLFS